jgi:aminopeptidase N
MGFDSHISPIHYNIHVVLPEEGVSFQGEIELEFNWTTVVDENAAVRLHAVGMSNVTAALDGHACDVAQEGGGPDAVLVIAVPSSVKGGAGDQAVLSVRYTGTLGGDDAAGLYRASYRSSPATDSPLASGFATFFAPTDARRAFPCLDEPACKASFRLTVTAAAIHRNFLSNTPAERDVRVLLPNGSTARRVTFGRTPRMSTYLLAFVVGSFDHVGAVAPRSGVHFRVFTPLGAADDGAFALKTGTAALDYLESFFDHPFPLPKQDMIALRDHSAGAMENWGLITYRETALLARVDAGSSAAARQRVANTVCHELAHQWFGNLVTPVEWSQLWLNEGFATAVGTQVVDALYPEMQNSLNGFLVQDMEAALQLDSLASSHPVEVNVEGSQDVGQLFDAISYRKGAAVLRMLFGWLGEDTTRRGLKDYLGRYAYGNATTANLWTCLSEASGLDVGREMDRWTKVVGFPRLDVSWDEDNKLLRIRQSRFLSAASDSDTLDDGGAWRMLLHIVVDAETGHHTTLHVTERDQTFPLKQRPVAVNDGFATLARVRYDADTMPVYRDEAAVRSLAPETRLCLVSDAYALANARQLDVPQALSLSLSLANDPEFSVLSFSLEHCSKMLTTVGVWTADSSAVREQDAGRALIRAISLARLQALGWTAREGEPVGDGQLRGKLIVTLGTTGRVAQVIAEARARLTRFVDEGQSNALDRNVMQGAVRVVAYNARGPDDVALIRRAYLAASSAEDAGHFVHGLAAFPDPQLARDAWAWAWSSPRVPANALAHVFNGLGTARDSTMWKIMQEQWPQFRQRFEASFRLLESFVTLACRVLRSVQHADEVESFFAEHGGPKVVRAVAQGVEGIRARAACADDQRKLVLAWLREHHDTLMERGAA